MSAVLEPKGKGGTTEGAAVAPAAFPPQFNPEFLEATRRLEQEWRAKFDAVAQKFGVDPAAYQRRTDSGLPVKPAYFPHDVASGRYDMLTAPGVYPFTRGLYPAQYQFMYWANQPVIGYGLPEDTRKRMDYLQRQGMTGYFGNTFYNLVYDLVSHEGLDPDHPAAEGRVGQCGMAVYSVEDNARLFDGLALDKINVIHISYYEVLPVLAHYLAYARRRGVPWGRLGGNSMSWYYQSAYVGMTCFPPKGGMDLAVELVNFCTREMPRWNTVNIFGYGMEEAGATAVQEVAFSVAAGIDYARACVASGLAPDRFLSRFGFQISQSNDFFEEICKIRALRRLWARKCHALGASDPKSMHVRIHTHTAGSVLTAQQPLNNLIRTTLHAFGAALSGTQAMEVSSFDEALAIPTEHAHTMALRIQQIIQEESGITRVADPLGGSYYVEALTDQIEAAAERIFDEVEARGGYHKCHDFVRSSIEESAARWRDQVDAKERIVVGMNKYESAEVQDIEIFRVDPESERIAVERVRELRARRDAKRWEAAMAALDDAAQRFCGGEIGVLMPAMIEAADADATTGELMGVLKKRVGWGSPY
ncbi:MAG: acyl-CoA mutase large subunit family protein [Burkholderiales bacterium]|nr:acyl-CoA mutase large subunit family protein [Burkholderiales bacterium]